jgi:hypothetical protein
MRTLNETEMAAVAGGHDIDSSGNNTGRNSFNHSQNNADSHAFPKQLFQGANTSQPTITNRSSSTTVSI